MIDIKLFGDTNLKGYTLIEGFPGVGLVGPMAISYIVDKLQMKCIGYIDSDRFPPIISIHKSEPMHSIRVYCADKEKLVTVFAEFAIPLDMITEMSQAIFDFAKKNGIANIYSIAGVPSDTDPVNVPYVIASNPEIMKNAASAGLKPIEEGVATGVSALLLIKAVSDKMPDICIMVPVQQSIIDPMYAEVAITSLNKLMNLNIDITELDKEAKMVEAKIRELMAKHKETHDTYKKSVDNTGPSMYA